MTTGLVRLLGVVGLSVDGGFWSYFHVCRHTVSCVYFVQRTLDDHRVHVLLGQSTEKSGE